MFVADQTDLDPAKEESAYKARDVWKRRPATSPERKVILSKVKNEKILSRNQTSSAARKSSSGIAVQSQRLLKFCIILGQQRKLKPALICVFF